MIVLTTFIPPEPIRNELETDFADAEFVYRSNPECSELEHAEILITYGEDLTAEHIRTAVQLKWIMVVSAGLEQMPLQEIKEKGITVTNARGIHKTPMAEYALGMMLSHEKKLVTLKQKQRKEVWDRDMEMGELFGKKALILGAGSIGSEIARLAQAFGMSVNGVNRSGRAVPFMDSIYRIEELNDALKEADYVISVLPSTAETRGLLAADRLFSMKKGSVLMNIGRGDLFKEEDLLEALKAGRPSHAILDVFGAEPLQPGHPYWKHPDITLTPHLSSRSNRYLPRAFRIFKDNLPAYLAKNIQAMKNVIDPDREY